MILAVDVRYYPSIAVVAGVIFRDWSSEAPEKEVVTCLEVPAAYQPGEFYKRELPCILTLIQEHHLQPDIIVVDGFVYLDGSSEPGLGRRLYDALGGKVAVIGVAKSAFKEIGAAYEVFRGGSKRPLYVTAVGVDLETAKRFIQCMHGEHRHPTLLKRVDRACRSVS